MMSQDANSVTLVTVSFTLNWQHFQIEFRYIFYFLKNTYTFNNVSFYQKKIIIKSVLNLMKQKEVYYKRIACDIQFFMNINETITQPFVHPM